MLAYPPISIFDVLLHDKLADGSFMPVWTAVNYKSVNAFLPSILLVMDFLEFHSPAFGASFQLLERNVLGHLLRQLCLPHVKNTFVYESPSTHAPMPSSSAQSQEAL
jgi:hypothetical protein